MKSPGPLQATSPADIWYAWFSGFRLLRKFFHLLAVHLSSELTTASRGPGNSRRASSNHVLPAASRRSAGPVANSSIRPPAPKVGGLAPCLTGENLTPGTEGCTIGSPPRPREARGIGAGTGWAPEKPRSEELTMGPAAHHLSIRASGADALFVSALQRSDDPSAGQIRQAIAAAIGTFDYSGCAGRVAQEFGDHPETAAARMRWARTVADEMIGHPAAA